MKKIITLTFSLAILLSAKSQIFNQFLFNSGNDNNVSTGTLAATTGTGTLAAVGGITSTFNAGYPNASNDNSGLYTTDYPAQGAAEGTAGIEVAVSTEGKANIFVSWWQYQTPSSSRYVKFLYSVDGGANWIAADFSKQNTFGTTGLIDATNSLFASNSGSAQVWYYRALDLSSVTAVNDNVNFRFKIVSAFDPQLGGYMGAGGGGYSNANNVFWRFDEVTVRQNSPLPISLGNFNASLSNGVTVLNWKTFSETNFSHFNIERSTDAVTFNQVGQVASTHAVAGAGYTFTDQSKLQGINYYRLDIVDNDGKNYYSPVVAVNARLVTGLLLYPNPVSSTLVLSHAKATAGATLQIISIDGKRVGAYTVQQGAVQTSINIGNVTKGNYFAVFQNGDKQKQSVKFVKQ